ncbi:hypothetical protein F383_34614 [Gossypium arboreum]|uniref:Uncharacterized protein n=1 Tax=Gossypium arboreum TaxID=29729 RepID=A0A0B0N8T3_GOSAR|nr:hypothetical protein F383_34614 [Gossypium arboreum]
MPYFHTAYDTNVFGSHACGWPCDPNQYVCPCLKPCEAHGLFPRACDPYIDEKFISFQNLYTLSV